MITSFCERLFLTLSFITSILFLCLLAFGSVGSWFVILLALIGFLLFRILPSAHEKQSSLNYPMLYAFSTMFGILVLIHFFNLYLENVNGAPLGGWDATAIWFLKSRFLFKGMSDGSWIAILKGVRPETHLDYPLFAPLSIVMGWKLFGGEYLLVPHLLNLFVAVLIALSVWKAAERAFAEWGGFVSGIFLLFLPLFQYASTQYADIWISCAMVLSYKMYSDIVSEEKQSSLALFAFGIALGSAMWAKNEGIPWVFFLLFGTGSSFLLLKRSEGILVLLKKMGFICIGLLPSLLSIICLKNTAQSSNDITGNALSGGVSRLFDIESWRLVADAMIKNIGVDKAPWIFVLIGVTVLGMLLQPKIRFRFLFLFSPIMLQSLSYMLAFLFSPHEIHWHINTSIDRLGVQLSPVILVVLCLMVSHWIPLKSRNDEGS